MKEIKFRYRLKQLCKRGYEEWFEFHTIEEIERGSMVTTAEIIARDLYIILKDKNGKEIYEGDIVSISMQGVRQDCFYTVKDLRSVYYDLDKSDSYLRIDKGTMEIIGNIYENPELLEEE